jgi:predicted transcriptional regulator
MKRITLRVDDRFDAELTALAKSLNLSKSQVIRVAVESYRKQSKREALVKRFRESSLKARVQAASGELTLGEAGGDGL